MYRSLTHREFQEGGGLSGLEGQVRTGGRETLGLGKRTFQKGKHVNKAWTWAGTVGGGGTQ